MSGEWKTTSHSQTGQTQYVIAEYSTPLTSVQPDPNISVSAAKTIAFNVEGYTNGITFAYQNNGTGIKTILDINNTQDMSNNWVATEATDTKGAGGFFLSIRNSFNAIRLRVVTANDPGNFTITNIKIMANS